MASSQSTSKSPSTSILRCGIAASVAFFAAVAFWRLHLPGLYYDEVLFLPPSAVLFEDCSLRAGIYFRLGCVPVILQPPYLGSLKALVHAAVHAIVPVGPVSLRVPMLLVLFASLSLFAAFWWRRLGPWLGLALMMLLLTDVVAITHARVDWGPYALSATFKMMAICLAISWIESRNPWRLVQLAVAIALGVFDKLNFLWVAGGIAAALVVVYWRFLRGALQALTPLTAIALGLIVVAAVAWLVIGILPVIRVSGGDRVFDLGRQIRHVWNLIGVTLDAGAYSLFYQEPWPGPRIHAAVFKVSMLLGLGVTAGLGVIRARHGREAPISRLAGWCAFMTVTLSVTILAMMLTKETGGTHHTVVLTQLWQLQLVTLIGTALAGATLAATHLLQVRAVVAAAGAAVIVALVVAQLLAGRYWIVAYDARKSGNPFFSPAIYELAEFVRAAPGIPVAVVDWGLGNNLIALALPGDRKRVLDLWSTFIAVGQGREHPSAPRRILGNATEVLLVMREERFAAFPAAIQGLEKSLSTDRACRSNRREVRDIAGTVQYVIARVPVACLAG